MTKDKKIETNNHNINKNKNPHTIQQSIIKLALPPK